MSRDRRKSLPASASTIFSNNFNKLFGRTTGTPKDAEDNLDESEIFSDEKLPDRSSFSKDKEVRISLIGTDTSQVNQATANHDYKNNCQRGRYSTTSEATQQGRFSTNTQTSLISDIESSQPSKPFMILTFFGILTIILLMMIPYL